MPNEQKKDAKSYPDIIGVGDDFLPYYIEDGPVDKVSDWFAMLVAVLIIIFLIPFFIVIGIIFWWDNR